VQKVLTNRSSYIENNKDIYLKIKERVFLSEETEEIFIKWLEYKNERGDILGIYPMKALAGLFTEKVRIWGIDAVTQVVMDCIASGYKNVVWEKLKMLRLPSAGFGSGFMDEYDHSALERLSRRDLDE
jgi:hypothetical protein